MMERKSGSIQWSRWLLALVVLACLLWAPASFAKVRAYEDYEGDPGDGLDGDLSTGTNIGGGSGSHVQTPPPVETQVVTPVIFIQIDGVIYIIQFAQFDDQGFEFRFREAVR